MAGAGTSDSPLARMTRFVVADVTDARSMPQEPGVIVPDPPSVPRCSRCRWAGAGEHGMFGERVTGLAPVPSSHSRLVSLRASLR
jgi:hypothetical protein